MKNELTLIKSLEVTKKCLSPYVVVFPSQFSSFGPKFNIISFSSALVNIFSKITGALLRPILCPHLTKKIANFKQPLSPSQALQVEGVPLVEGQHVQGHPDLKNRNRSEIFLSDPSLTIT